MGISKSEKPDLSVIIPVYNVESYIKECAESLFKQTLENIEYIFIDDASSDSSLNKLQEVIERFPQRKNQIKIIRHQENRGTAYTREEGIKQSRGRWIIHCDSDDYLGGDIYGELLDYAKKTEADMVMFDYRRFSENGRTQEVRHGKGEIKSRDLLQRITGCSNLIWHGSLWNRIIKRELWEKVEYPKEISYCEDAIILIQILIQNPNLNIQILPSIGYNYRKRENSLITQNDAKREKEIKRVIRILENIRDANNPIYKNSLDSKIIGLVYRLLFNSSTIKITSKPYYPYKDKIKLNKELNRLKVLFLKTALNGNYRLAGLIRYGNIIGLRGLNYYRKITGRV